MLVWLLVLVAFGDPNVWLAATVNAVHFCHVMLGC